MKYLFLFLPALLLSVFSCSHKMNEEDQGEATAADKAAQSVTSPDMSGQDLWEINSQAGINFIATGNEPFWAVKINFGQNMVFSTPEAAEKLVTPIPDPVRPQDVAAISYRAETEKGTLQVTVFQEKCMDSMSGKENPYKVQVSLKMGDETEFTDYTGCGHFMGDYRMHDIWALIQLDGEDIDPANFPNGVPSLDLQMNEGKVYGNAGCNQFSGNIMIGNGNLKFGPLMSTKMACPALEYETRYTAALSDKPLEYKLEDGQLYLTNGRHQLVFKKVD